MNAPEQITTGADLRSGVEVGFLNVFAMYIQINLMSI